MVYSQEMNYLLNYNIIITYKHHEFVIQNQPNNYHLYTKTTVFPIQNFIGQKINNIYFFLMILLIQSINLVNTRIIMEKLFQFIQQEDELVLFVPLLPIEQEIQVEILQNFQVSQLQKTRSCNQSQSISLINPNQIKISKMGLSSTCRPEKTRLR
ncbi:unnamed protein product [Paramecium primaurelia]|uniref:Transmembrane protein n=1 Tax=Paramecium primaurelia TaxID=5886 RepID=A0A8S1NE47_PARPR|nr:unnamed protein product [Paramecium primaurelia]